MEFEQKGELKGELSLYVDRGVWRDVPAYRIELIVTCAALMKGRDHVAVIEKEMVNGVTSVLAASVEYAPRFLAEHEMQKGIDENDLTH